MSSSLLIAPLKIDPAVWRIEIPLVVLERCTSPAQVCVWIAVRWLRAAHQKKRGFGTREIARRANVNQKTVTGAIEHLLEMRLLEPAGEEHGQGGWKKPRLIYDIPLIQLEHISSGMAPQVLARWGVKDLPPVPSPEQMTIDEFTDPKTDRSESTDPKTVRSTDPKADRSEGTDPKTVRSTDPKADRSGRMEGRMEGGEEGVRSPAQNNQQESEPSPLLPPSPPPGQPAISAHPLLLWPKVRPEKQMRAIEADQLLLWASAYDQKTDGHGLYWVGRAILAASLKSDLLTSIVVRQILERWSSEDSWGSDAPAKPQKEKGNGQRQRTDNEPRSNGRVSTADEQHAVDEPASAAEPPMGVKPFRFDDSWDTPSHSG